MKKRVLSLIMAVALAVTLAPAAVSQASQTTVGDKGWQVEADGNAANSPGDITIKNGTGWATAKNYVDPDFGEVDVVRYLKDKEIPADNVYRIDVNNTNLAAGDTIKAEIVKDTTNSAWFNLSEFGKAGYTGTNPKVTNGGQTATVECASPVTFPLTITNRKGQVLVRFTSTKAGTKYVLNYALVFEARDSMLNTEKFIPTGATVDSELAKVEAKKAVAYLMPGNRTETFRYYFTDGQDPIGVANASPATIEATKYDGKTTAAADAVQPTGTYYRGANPADAAYIDITFPAAQLALTKSTGEYEYTISVDDKNVGKFVVYFGGRVSLVWQAKDENDKDITITTKRVNGVEQENAYQFTNVDDDIYFKDGATLAQTAGVFNALGGDSVYKTKVTNVRYAEDFINATKKVVSYVQLPELVREGYDFLGWAELDKNGNIGETVLSAGARVPVAGNAVYVAVWSDNYYTINYHANDGSGLVVQRIVLLDNNSKENGIAQICDPYSLGIYNYGNEFRAWKSKKSVDVVKAGDYYITPALNENGYVVISGEDYEMSFEELMEVAGERNEVNLYADWAKAAFTVTYHYDVKGAVSSLETLGGRLPYADVDPVYTLYDTEDKDKQFVSDKPGYIIKGWSVTADAADAGIVDFPAGRALDRVVLEEAAAANGEVYNTIDFVDVVIDGTTYVILNQNVDLWPVYEAKTYTLNFTSTRGGVGSMEPQTRTYGKNANLPGCGFTLNGNACDYYKIDGNYVDTQNKNWTDTAANDALIWDLVDGFKNNAVINVDVQWKTARFEVTFLNEDGSVFVQSGTNNNVCRTPNVVPVKAGYTFKGWTDGTNTYGVDAEIRGINYNTSFEPIFEEATFRITYDVLVEGNYLFDTYKVSDLPLALKDFEDNYGEFLGWNIKGKSDIIDELPEGTTGDVNLEANWKPYATGVQLTAGVQKNYDYSTPQIAIEREIEEHIQIMDTKNGKTVGVPYDDARADVEYKYSSAWETTPARGSSQKITVTAVVKLSPDYYCNADSLEAEKRTVVVTDIVVSGANAEHLPGVVAIEDKVRTFPADVSLGTVLGALTEYTQVEVTDENGKKYTTPVSYVGSANIGGIDEDGDCAGGIYKHALYDNNIAEKVIKDFKNGKKVIYVDSCPLWAYDGSLHYSRDYNQSRLTIYIGVKPVTPGAVEVVEQLDPELDNPVKGGIYRVFNPKTGEHIYTADYNEYSLLVKKYGWTNEHLRYISATGSEAVQVMRLFNPETGEHIYTIDDNERKVLTSKYGWVLDDSTFKVYKTDSVEGQIEVNRVFNPNAETAVSSHVYTSDDNEVKVLTSKYGWDDEGVAFKLDLPK